MQNLNYHGIKDETLLAEKMTLQGYNQMGVIQYQNGLTLQSSRSLLVTSIQFLCELNDYITRTQCQAMCHISSTHI